MTPKGFLTKLESLYKKLFPVSPVEPEEDDFGGKLKNELEENHINGKVKAIFIKSFNVIDKLGVVHKGEVMKSRESLKYDKNGNSIEHIEFDDTDALTMHVKKSNRYENGNCVEKRILDKDNNLIMFMQIEYNPLTNNFACMKFFEKDGTLKSIHKHKYDRKGNKIEMVIQTVNSALSTKFQYLNDEKDRCIEVKVFGFASIEMIRRNNYDENGNLVQISSIAPNGKLLSREIFKDIQHDSMGNWISRIEIKGDKPAKIVEREIEYYSDNEQTDNQEN